MLGTRAYARSLLDAVARVAADDSDPRADAKWPMRFILNHACWKELSEILERPLDLLPFSGAVYITDTGDNLGKLQNKSVPAFNWFATSGPAAV